jgi:hypothetical protein
MAILALPPSVGKEKLSCCRGLSLGAYLFLGSFGFLVVLGCFFGFLGVCWGLTFVFLGFWGFSLFFGFPLCLWASWVVPLYTSCVLRALYAFFNKIFLLIKKKRNNSYFN